MRTNRKDEAVGLGAIEPTRPKPPSTMQKIMDGVEEIAKKRKQPPSKPLPIPGKPTV